MYEEGLGMGMGKRDGVYFVWIGWGIDGEGNKWRESAKEEVTYWVSLSQ